MKEQNLAQRLKEIRARGPLHREAEVGAVDLNERTVELSFSSELEYRRWFGIEILGHEPGMVRLDRLNDSAAVLWNHDWDDMRGVVVPGTARIDEDKKGRAVIRLSRSADGEQLLQDIADGIVTKVSVGYIIHGVRLVERRDDVEVLLVDDWEPYEISLVSVPADPSVGVGRKAEIPQEEKPAEQAENTNHRNTDDPADQPNPEGINTMKVKVLRAANGDLVRAEVNDADEITNVLEVLEKAGEDVRSLTQRGSEAERKRVAAILEMGEKYQADDLARQFVRENKSPEEFQRALLERFNERSAKPLAEQNRNAEIGMSERDLAKYSLFRAIRALLPGATRADIEAAAFEFECSRAAAEKYEKEPKGILVPADVLGRAFNAGGASNTPTGATSGSNLVATELMSGSFIEMLRNRTTLMRLGRPLAGLVGNVDIPKQIGGATAYWIGEGQDATEGTPVIGQVSLSPKTVAAYTDITRRLMKQSTPDAEGIVRSDLLNAVAQAIDHAGYYGTGTGNQPLGLVNISGINGVDFTNDYPTFEELVQMESEVAADNADVNSMAYVFNARMRGHAKTTPKFGAGTEATIWEAGNTVNGYRAEVTNQIADGEVFFGNFADLIIGMWGGLDLTVDPYSLSKSGGLRLVVFQDMDFVLRRTESICFGKKPTTP